MPNRRSVLLLAPVVGLAALGGAACSAHPARSPSAIPAPQDSSTAAKQQAVTDSIEGARANQFFTELQKRSGPMIARGNYLGILNLIDALIAAAGPSEGVREMSGQMIGTYASLLGQEHAALEAFLVGGPRREAPDTASFAGYAPEDAVDAIVKLAADRQVVFVNEAHHVPRDRAFTAALLPRLRALGFTHLGAEALFESESTLNARDYPVRATGLYTNEPTFGTLLRTARQLGFILVPYESVSQTQDGRETGEARNLVDRVFAKNPRARLIVHAGYGHIDESGAIAGAKTMAVRFREMTGIDPLTVDQTVMQERGDSLHEDPRYRYLLHRYAPRVPIVLRKGDSVWSANRGSYDVSVIQPRAIYRDGRPDWLWAMDDRRRFPLPRDVCASRAECAVTARFESESPDAVPVDALRIGPRGSSRTLALPPGNYVIAAKDGAGVLLGERRVTISR